MTCFLRKAVTLVLFLVGTNSLSSQRKRQRIPVMHYDDNWVCVDKPCGMTVHRSKSTPKHKQVLTTAVKRQLSRKAFPVHRLDHRTSGAILFALILLRLVDCTILLFVMGRSSILHWFEENGIEQKRLLLLISP